MMPWWLALLSVAVSLIALPMRLQAGGAPVCPQVLTCSAGAVFTELGDVDCDRVLNLTDLALLVRAPFCDACRNCMSKDANADARVSVADVTALIKILAQLRPTSTPTRSSTPAPPTTSTPTSAAATPTPTAKTATDYSYAFTFGAPAFVISPLSRPIGTAIDAGGDIWIADERNRVLRLNSTGGYVYTIGAGGSQPGYFTASVAKATHSYGGVKACE